MKRRTLLGSAVVAAAGGTAAWLGRRNPATPTRAPHRPHPRAWADRGLFAAWLGHSTVLLKIDGTVILTDPVFSTRIGADLGLFTVGPKRLVAPALAIAELPKIDVLLLSHAHFDHFDLPSLRQLESRGTTVVTAARTADLLRAGGYRQVHELQWGGRAAVGPVEIRAFRVNHWGARMTSDIYRGYNGYVLEAGRYRVVFAGDTAWTEQFRELKTSRPFDLAVMPVGAYNPWVHYHCTPEQAIRMADDAGADRVIPVHHQTFALSREPYMEPIERACAAVGSDTARVVIHHIGQGFSC